MRVLPTKLPKVSPTRFDVGFLQSGVVAYLIPLMGSVQIARVNAHASRLVGNLALLKKVFHAPVVVAGRSSRNFPRRHTTSPSPFAPLPCAQACPQLGLPSQNTGGLPRRFPSNPGHFKRQCLRRKNPEKFEGSGGRAPARHPTFPRASIARPP